MEAIYNALKKPQECLQDAIADEALCLCVEHYDLFEEKARKYTQKFAMSEVCCSICLNLNLNLNLCYIGRRTSHLLLLLVVLSDEWS